MRRGMFIRISPTTINKQATIKIDGGDYCPIYCFIPTKPRLGVMEFVNYYQIKYHQVWGLSLMNYGIYWVKQG